ncbi:hypothetical protein QL285_096986 [Trifolium repens]|nr:hypothetical protein QL285_096986 [Trifolium repens]
MLLIAAATAAIALRCGNLKPTATEHCGAVLHGDAAAIVGFRARFGCCGAVRRGLERRVSRERREDSKKKKKKKEKKNG